MATPFPLESTARSVPYPELGELLCTRGKSHGVKVLVYVMITLFAAVIAWALYESIEEYRRAGWVRAKEPFMATGFLAVVLTGTAWTMLYRARRGLSFYEHGAVLSRVFRRDTCLRYDDLEKFVFHLVRYYTKGVYGGAWWYVTMRTASGEKIKLGIRSKEKPSLLSMTILGNEFSPDEEMEGVHLQILEILRAKWIDRLNHGDGMDWAGQCRITKHGIEPTRGKLRGSLIKFEEVGDVKLIGYFLRLHRHEEKSPFCLIRLGGMNFNVGLALLNHYVGECRGEAGAFLQVPMTANAA